MLLILSFAGSKEEEKERNQSTEGKGEEKKEVEKDRESENKLYHMAMTTLYIRTRESRQFIIIQSGRCIDGCANDNRSQEQRIESRETRCQ